MRKVYKVTIWSSEDDSIVEQFEGKSSKRLAERVENGVNINLDHENYYTTIEEDEVEEKEEGFF